MNLLLDTHIALWAITDSPKLPQVAKDLIQAPTSTVWVSAASVWEIAMKRALGKGLMPVSSVDALRYFQQAGYHMLAITAEHTVAVEALPLHHNDPFDRLLVAQAITEPLRLITHDALVALYSDNILKV